MSFQILNAKGEALSLGQLDEEAANYWKVPIRDNKYATPFLNDVIKEKKNNPKMSLQRHVQLHTPEYAANWFDYIGWFIHSTQNEKCTWNSVIGVFCDIHEKSLNEIKEDKFLSPFINLIYHFQEKKYVPKYVH